MNQAEARRRIWQRLAVTALHDIDNADWVDDESDDEPDKRRLLKACRQVATSIRRRLATTQRRSKDR